MTPLGLRKVRVFKEVPANEETIVDNRGAYVYVEVTNTEETEIEFIPNDYVEHGYRTAGIPIPAGETRKIPMAVYKFKATGVVTVVAYGM